MRESNYVYKILPSGSHFIRFESLQDIFWFDERENNPNGIGIRHSNDALNYKAKRSVLSESKNRLIAQAQKELSVDKDFLALVYKGKSQKRRFDLNKFVGNLSMPHYASQNDKIFKKSEPGAKKQVLNMAFQVGTFVGGNYTESFIKILKTIMMCQAMNINVNIDMFDSDTYAINRENGYVIVNVAKSSEKLNFRTILAASHNEFFNYTLFNGYSASGKQQSIGTFLGESRIIRDLGEMYDVIGGNLLLDTPGHQSGSDLVSKILKIGIHG